MVKGKENININRREFIFSSSFFLCFLAMPFKKALAGIPEIMGSRVGINGDKTRFVLDLSKEVDYNLFILKNPDRIVIDFPYLEWSNSSSEGKGLIQKYRFARFSENTSRLVLDLTEPAMVYESFILPASQDKGPRLVVDLVKDNKTETIIADIADAKQEDNISAPIVETSKKEKKIITIDPGHGGVDPGAIGVGGVYEKDITLKTAKELKKELEESGKYKVYLTRSDDRYLKLWQRVQIARKYKSDLFISLHADSIKDRQVKGASMYTLAEKASDARAAQLAAKENKVDLIFDEKLEDQPKEVADILLDLKRREILNSAKILANGLIGQMRKNDVNLLNKNHRYAAFAVLKAPDVPSILIELGFVTNKQEVKLLNTYSYRSKINKSILSGIEQHFA
jgi:N-acetylmuramoyl-L-alanine amidase